MKQRWFPFWVFPVVIALAIGTVWLRLWIVRTTYAINQADKDMRTLRLQREQLDVKFATVRSPRKLETLARTKFKLNQPNSNQVVYFK